MGPVSDFGRDGAFTNFGGFGGSFAVVKHVLGNPFCFESIEEGEIGVVLDALFSV